METNALKNNYKNMPLYESHAHLSFENTIDNTAGIYGKVMQYYSYDKLHVCALPSHDITENYKALYVKAKLAPNVFASAGLMHHYDTRDTAEYYLSEIKKYHAMGFDGMKMLEGKVELYRKVGKPLDDAVFDLYYGYAEENNIPILLHLGDPASAWDITKISKYALEKGWFCSEDDPTREELRSQVDGILQKFPKLKLTLAHFYFMGDELERAAELLDRYENVRFDLTPGGEMLVQFSAQHEKARSFFVKYQNRLLFGTDMYNYYQNDNSMEAEYGGLRVNQLRTFLEKKEAFVSPLLGEEPLLPFHFEDDILSRIYHKNFISVYGAMPRMLDVERIAEDCARIAQSEGLDTLQTGNINTISQYFQTNSDALHNLFCK